MKILVKAYMFCVSKASWAVVIVTLALFGVFGYLASQAEVAQGNEGFSPDNEELLAAERIRDLFGKESQEGVLQVIVRQEGGDVFTKDALQTIQAINAVLESDALADNLSSIPGRGASFTYLDPVLQSAGQGSGPIENDAAVKSAYLTALTAPGTDARYTSLVSTDGDPYAATAQAGLVLVFTKAPAGDTEDAFDLAVANDAEVADALRSIPAPEGLEIIPFSFNLLFEDSGDFTGEVGRLFGMAALIILLILAFVYWLKPTEKGAWLRSGRRTLADTLLTLFTIFAGISFMQGVGVLLERAGIIGSFNPVTQIIPILLIGLGVDYGIHITSRYREEVGRGQEVEGAIRSAIGTVGVALALATVTTTIGFLTNVLNPVPALKDFGLLAAVGIVVSFTLMLTFFPAARKLLDRRTERKGSLPIAGMKASSDRLLPRLIARTSVLAEKIPVVTLMAALVLGGLGVWGLTQLETRFSFTDFLPKDAPGIQGLEILQEEFGGGLGESTQVLIEGENLSSAEIHNALVLANRGLADVENVVVFNTPDGKAASVTSPVSLLSFLQRDGPQGPPPEAITSAAQLVNLGDHLRVADDTDITPLWNAILQSAPGRARGVLHQSGAGYDAALFDIGTQAGETEAFQLQQDLLEAFSGVSDLGVSVIATSSEIISNVIVNELADSQTRSLLLTLVVATVVLMISFWFENRRPFLGVLTMLPVALVVFWTYGLMYATGIPFGPVAATLAALAVGIGVPYTIHIARRFEEDRLRFEDLKDALRSTCRHTGGALAGSAFTTMAGFGILMTSTLTPFQQMGQVTVYAIGLSLVGSVLVLPSLLALWEAWHRRRSEVSVAFWQGIRLSVQKLTRQLPVALKMRRQLRAD